MYDDSPIAVLGGGNGGHTMAADLTLAGHEVNFYEHPRFEEGFAEVIETQQVTLRGIGRTGVADLKLATTDIEEAVADAELINLAIPAFGQDLFFETLIPHLRDGQTVVIWAGDFGSLRLDYLLEEKGSDKEVTIVETNTLPYGTRLLGPGEVKLFLSAPRVTLAALPARRTDEVLEQLRRLWPDILEDSGNVLAATFSNPNPICHPPGSLLNVGRIQWSEGDFYMYKEGITEAVARVIRDLYEETAALAEAMDCSVVEYEDRDFRSPGTIMSRAFEAPFHTLRVIGEIQGPKSIDDRYITEDLPYGLVPMSQLGDKLGVPTPLMDAIVTMGSYVCDVDFWKEGRTLDKLGIEDMDAEQILSYVTEGR